MRSLKLAAEWYLATRSESLRILAEPTGGFAPADGDNLPETLRRIDLAMRD
jgi:excinuclease UvrABC ATPase subunit